jgi:hypothetical protein
MTAAVNMTAAINMTAAAASSTSARLVLEMQQRAKGWQISKHCEGKTGLRCFRHIVLFGVE